MKPMPAVIGTSVRTAGDSGKAGPPPQRRRLGLVVRQELRLMRADPSFWIVGLLFAVLVAYALLNGISQTRARSAAQTAFLRDDGERRAAQVERLERILRGAEPATPFGNPANPEHVAGDFGAQHAWMPPAALAPVALGQTDLFPSQFKVSYQSKAGFEQTDDIENPWSLLSGHFDLAFVIVYVLPLLVLATSYNVLSAERESGTLRLLLSQPLTLRTMLAGKIGLRTALLLAISIGGPLGLLFAARPAETLDAGALAVAWALIVGGYALFWFALVVAVNAFGRSSATNAIVLVVGWVLIVLVLPVLLNLGITTFNPAPSRTELSARIRVVTADAMARNAQLLATDYQHVGKPELLLPKDGRIALSGRSLANYRIEREIDTALAPDLQRFAVQQARQQQLALRWSFVSPAASVYQAMTDLAGNGERRHAHFMRQVDAYHAAWKGFFFPRIDDGRALTLSDYAAMPTFAWHEEDAGVPWSAAVRTIVQLLALIALLSGVAAWRLRRFDVV